MVLSSENVLYNRYQKFSFILKIVCLLLMLFGTSEVDLVSKPMTSVVSTCSTFNVTKCHKVVWLCTLWDWLAHFQFYGSEPRRGIKCVGCIVISPFRSQYFLQQLLRQYLHLSFSGSRLRLRTLFRKNLPSTYCRFQIETRPMHKKCLF